MGRRESRGTSYSTNLEMVDILNGSPGDEGKERPAPPTTGPDDGFAYRVKRKVSWGGGLKLRLRWGLGPGTGLERAARKAVASKTGQSSLQSRHRPPRTRPAEEGRLALRYDMGEGLGEQ